MAFLFSIATNINCFNIWYTRCIILKQASNKVILGVDHILIKLNCTHLKIAIEMIGFKSLLDLL